MDIEIFLVFSILIAALVLFLTGWIRMDLVALLILSVLAITGLVTPTQALSGFSNPAVIVVWSMFILSAAIYQTGVARLIGRRVLKYAGNREWQIIILIMGVSGLLSTIMSNIGVAALMLPVVMDVARSTGRSPGRLLIPLAISTHLGGITTLIGTPPNLLVSYQLEEAGYTPLTLFDFSPVGFGVMLTSILFVAFIGRHLLPTGKTLKKKRENRHQELTESYHLEERSFSVRINQASSLAGKTLAESRLRAALGINVLSVKRKGGGTILNPGPDIVLRANDKLYVQGKYETLKALEKWKAFLPRQKGIDPFHLNLAVLNLFEAKVGKQSPLLGRCPGNPRHLKAFNLRILAIKRNKKVLENKLSKEIIYKDDTILIQVHPNQTQHLINNALVENINPITKEELIHNYRLHESLFFMEITQDTELFDDTTSHTQLDDAFGLTVLGVMEENDQLISIDNTDERITPSSPLLVHGNIKDLPLLSGLLDIEIVDEKIPGAHSLETDEVTIAEVVLAPRSLLAGKTLREINFRKKYGLNVLALWREGKAFRTNLHNTPIRFGEALLLYGKRNKISLIADEPDFILLTDTLQQPFRTKKAVYAIVILSAALLAVILDILPLPISLIIGVVLMVLTGCLKMEEAYRAIDWRAVFLIAGLLPLGIAIEQSGTGTLMAQQAVNLLGQYGPWGMLAGLYLITLFATIAIHPAALVVIMAPVAIQAAENLNASPHSFMIAIAIAASGSFLSPVTHPANLLMMAPGGYTFANYLKIGLPFSFFVMAMVFILLSVFWPF